MFLSTVDNVKVHMTTFLMLSLLNLMLTFPVSKITIRRFPADIALYTCVGPVAQSV